MTLLILFVIFSQFLPNFLIQHTWKTFFYQCIVLWPRYNAHLLLIHNWKFLKLAFWFVKDHRVDRVLGLFSSRPNWDSPAPHPQASVNPPPPPLPWGSGGAQPLVGEGVGGGSQFGRADRYWLKLKFNNDIQTRRYYLETGDHVAVLEPGLQRSLCGRLRLL